MRLLPLDAAAAPRLASSDEQGRYRFAGLPGGTYAVEACWEPPQRHGPSLRDRALVTLQAGALQRVDLVLAP